MELTKLKRQRATDEVYEAMRQGILTHLFKPGERLWVEEIASKLGVSLTPVRHAIQQLATEGLVDIHPRSGTYVASLSAQDVEDTFDIRCALECLAAEKAVSKLTADDVAHLKKLLKGMAKSVRNEDDLKEHERLNSELHQVFLSASGNRRLGELYTGLNAHLKIARIHGAERNWTSRLEDEQSEHEEIVAAAEARDAKRLTSALRKHINRAKTALVATLKASE